MTNSHDIAFSYVSIPQTVAITQRRNVVNRIRVMIGLVLSCSILFGPPPPKRIEQLNTRPIITRILFTTFLLCVIATVCGIETYEKAMSWLLVMAVGYVCRTVTNSGFV